MPGSPPSRVLFWGAPLVAGALAAAMAGGWFVYREREWADEKREQREDLSAIVRMKSERLVAWRDERLGDAKSIFASPWLVREVRAIVAHPGDTARARELKHWLNVQRAHFRYHGVLVLDPAGRVVMAAADPGEVVGPDAVALLRAALRTRAPRFGDLARDENSDVVKVDLVVPLVAAELPEPVGALLLRVDAGHSLYPLVQAWPRPSASAQALLVRREGDQVVFLQDLPAGSRTAFSFRLPLGDPRLPAAAAARGYEGSMEGRDYRGAPVLAATRQIPGTDWHLVAKIDTREVYAALRDRLRRVALLLALLWATVATGAILVARRHHERERLLGEVQRLAADLQATNDALRDKSARLVVADRRKDEFLAVLAHELRNPLAAIGAASYMLERSGPPVPAAALPRTVIARQTAHLARLVDDLLDVARITRGTVELRTEELDLRDVMQRAVEATQHVIAERQHALQLTLPPEPLPLTGDRVRLEQVVCNLLSNAARYMEPNGRIWAAAERDGDAIVLRVRDTGIGIATDLLPRIFEPFVQAAPRSARAGGGLGIGLALVQDLVRLHGGTVTARSDGPDRGSEFAIRLPALARREPARSATAEDGPPTGAGAARRVVVVDDDQDVAEMLSQAVGSWGHPVRVAHGGEEAIALITADPPEVVLLDIGLPDVDGYEVARRLRGRLPPAAGIRLVALTGFGQPEDRARAFEAGFDRHLTKPVDLEALARLLAELPGEVPP